MVTGSDFVSNMAVRVSPQVRRLLLVALTIQIVLVLFVLTQSLSFGSAELVFERPAELSNVATPITPESAFPLAEAYARQWSADAVLIAVTMRLDWQESEEIPATELPGRGWIIYVFADGTSTMSLYLDRGTGILIGSDESEFGRPDWPEFDLATYPRSSEIAALTANITSGDSYRKACPDRRRLALVTASHGVTEEDSSGRTGTSVWTVTYGDSDYPGTFDVLVKLDAVTGDVLVNEVRDRPCEE